MLLTQGLHDRVASAGLTVRCTCTCIDNQSLSNLVGGYIELGGLLEEC
jgi:hypothetical protein